MRYGVLTVGLMIAVCVCAQESEKPSAKPAREGALDIIFVMDDSGSMRETDPEALRVVAVKAFLDLTQDRGGDRVAVVRFAGWSESEKNDDFLVCDLTPMPRESAARRAALEKMKAKLTERMKGAGFYTDFNFAFEVALKRVLKSRKRGGGTRPVWVILFTDGSMNPERGRTTPDPLGVDPVLPDFYLKRLKEKRELWESAQLRKAALDAFPNVLAETVRKTDKGYTLDDGSPIYLTAIYLDSSGKAAENMKKNRVLGVLAEKTGAKGLLATRDPNTGGASLKSVFFDALATLPKGVYRPGVAKCFGEFDQPRMVGSGQVETVGLHLYQGAISFKVVLFCNHENFDVTLLAPGKDGNGLTPVALGPERVLGGGERYRIVDMSGMKWGDYRLKVKNTDAKRNLVLEKVEYAQFALSVEVSEQALRTPVAGDSLHVLCGGEGELPEDKHTFRVVVKDDKGEVATDELLLRQAQLTVGLRGEPHTLRYAPGETQKTDAIGLGLPGGPQEATVAVAVIPLKTGDFAYRTPEARLRFDLLAPRLSLKAPAEALVGEKVILGADAIGGALNETQKSDGVTIELELAPQQEGQQPQRIKAVMKPNEDGDALVGEATFPAAGKWTLGGRKRWGFAWVENAEELSVLVKERALALAWKEAAEKGESADAVRIKGYTEEEYTFTVSARLLCAPDEKGVTVEFVGPVRDGKVDRKRVVCAPGEPVEFTFTLKPMEEWPGPEKLRFRAWVERNPQETMTEGEMELHYEYVVRPFPWWILAVAGAALLFIIILAILLSRPCFTEQQVWVGTENRYMLKDWGKRKAKGLAELPETVSFSLKGPKKSPVCYASPISAAYSLFMDEQPVSDRVQLHHGAFLKLVPAEGEVGVDFRYFEREPTEAELLGVPYEPGVEYFLIIEDEP